ncbi:isopentenyl transferase family protein [Saccharothrix deserti]|uniref:isopentenyl transferase family protein n=1 Tax=Saccharothrix deserti TaxID=2593674 RepID=UPI00131BF008|nr:isopentenyl transferase family protein [Saccharothrix deserti]
MTFNRKNVPAPDGDRWPLVHVIAGPTGTGKSDIAMALAAEHGAPVVVADRIQCFRDLPVTSARLDSDPTTGVVRHHLRDLLVTDGDYDPDDAARDLERQVKILIERHPVVVVEGGSLSLLQRFVKSRHQFRLTADILRMPDAETCRCRLRSRAERMLRPAVSVPGLLEEFAAAWRHPARREFVASVNGFDAVVLWCRQHDLDPCSVTDVLGDDRLVGSVADLVADLHAHHGREQDEVFAGLFGPAN